MSETPLTETQLLAMSRKDYMNPAQLAFFRERLLELKRTLAENVSATSEHLRTAEAPSDPSDLATQVEEQTLELRTRERERKMAETMDEALARIDNGTYGYCEETGEPIGLKRLLARPTATLTIDAQERREKQERAYGR